MEYKREGSPIAWFIIKLLFIGVIAILVLDLILVMHNLAEFTSNLQNFATIFLNISLEGVPFIIIGSLASALIEVFISEEAIAKFIPRRRFLGMLSAVLIGFILPVCECAIVPIAKRLINKGIPVGMAVTFMLATPIINPIVIASTYYAFSDKPYMIFARIGLGAFGAVIIGYLMGALQGNRKVVCKFRDEEAGCGHCEEHHHAESALDTFVDIIKHTSSEFYDIGRLFMFGALLSTCMQTFMPKDILLSIGKGNLSSILVMMTTAFLLSICSDTDAFIARTFIQQFTGGSVLAFLIMGPMIDIKNTIMLSGSFDARFVTKLIFLIVTVCFLIAVMSNLFLPWLI
jgi:uncharacterized protein